MTKPIQAKIESGLIQYTSYYCRCRRGESQHIFHKTSQMGNPENTQKVH